MAETALDAIQHVDENDQLIKEFSVPWQPPNNESAHIPFNNHYSISESGVRKTYLHIGNHF